MAKRTLSPGYRAGAATLVAMLHELETLKNVGPFMTGQKIYATRSSMDDVRRAGFGDTLALWIHMNLVEGVCPCLDRWDPIKELKDTDYWQPEQ
jgi:hypothetical protein